jgi:hypothetical protein
LYSPVSAYPVPNPIYPLPMHPDPTVTEFVEAAANGPLASARTILFAGSARQPMIDWFRAFFEARGYVVSAARCEGKCLLTLTRP